MYIFKYYQNQCFKRSALLVQLRQSYLIIVSKSANRPPGLIIIVVYKILTALILAITTLALFFTLENHQTFVEIAETYTLEGKLQVIRWLLEKLLQLNPKTLRFAGITTCIYSIVTIIEAVGLWYQKTWAKVLVVVLVAISIPPEVFELISGFAPVKLGVLVVNLAVFWYLLRRQP